MKINTSVGWPLLALLLNKVNVHAYLYWVV